MTLKRAEKNLTNIRTYIRIVEDCLDNYRAYPGQLLDLAEAVDRAILITKESGKLLSNLQKERPDLFEVQLEDLPTLKCRKKPTIVGMKAASSKDLARD